MTWGGVAVAVIVGASGIIVAAVRGRMMWIWPTLALVLIVVALGIGVHLADSLMHHASQVGPLMQPVMTAICAGYCVQCTFGCGRGTVAARLLT